MFKILVPTDFSECSKEAILYANDFANLIGNAELHILHCAVIGKLSTTRDANDQTLYSEVIESLDEGMKSFDRFMEQFSFDVPVQHRITEGRPAYGILRYASQNNIDQIIMGTHGASGLREWAIGSNTQNILRQSPCPVLAIKHYNTPLRLKHILFVSDFEEETLPLFKHTADLATRTDAELHLLNVETPDKFFQIPIREIESMKSMAKMFDGTTTIHTNTAWNVENGIKKAIETLDIDLVVMANHGLSGFRYLFYNSITEGVVNHLDIPVLTARIRKEKEDVTQKRYASFREI